MSGKAVDRLSWTRFLPPRRYGVYVVCLVLTVLSLCLLWFSLWWLMPLIIFGSLSILGTWDVFQRRRTVSCNYPIMAHFRYQLEMIGPEIRQYFVESDQDHVPYSREQRSLIYQRSKAERDTKPFGSLSNMYQQDYQWLAPSIKPVEVAGHDFRVAVGHEATRHPYSASVLNISAMSFGSLSAHAISALNIGARLGGFYHDTGEGAISPHHRRGGDLVWELGTAYFGCRDDKGRFDEELFAAGARDDQVKMIEIKLSQGAKPGHGGVLPGAKVSVEIARTRGVPRGKTVVSPSSHSTFSTPLEMLAFISHLRELSGGKPVGFKLAIGHPWEWFAVVKAMLETGEYPDFVVVDGGEGGTGAAPIEFTNNMGMPLKDALLLVHNTLVGTNLREHIRIGAAGKIASAFDMARIMALGADWCNAARGFMFSLGCIQARACNTDRCPSGVATQSSLRGRQLDVADKSQRVRNFQQNTLQALAEMVAAAGLQTPAELRPDHMLTRISTNKIQSYAELYHFMKPGEILTSRDLPEVYGRYWHLARPDTFEMTNAVA